MHLNSFDMFIYHLAAYPLTNVRDSAYPLMMLHPELSMTTCDAKLTNRC